jgi:pteridine reductase
VDNHLQGKVVLITGGAKRVGAAISERLHQHGAHVMIHYHHSASEANALKTKLNQLRPNSADTICCDLLDIPKIATLVSQTVERFGRLDILVNNASSYYASPLGDIDETKWNDLIGTNLKSPLFLSQAAAMALKETQGTIVNIADMHVERPKKNYSVYSVAKAGLMTLTKSLAIEMAPHVRVNAVAPGPVLWPSDNPDFTKAYQDLVIRQTLLERMGSPEDIAKTVLFLVADAPYITGQIIAVDGGRSINMK